MLDPGAVSLGAAIEVCKIASFVSGTLYRASESIVESHARYRSLVEACDCCMSGSCLLVSQYTLQDAMFSGTCHARTAC
jgi:hypothetical protein